MTKEGYETKRDKRRDYGKEKTKKRIKAEAFEDSDVSQDNVRRKRDRAYASEDELDVKEERSRRHGAEETYSRNIDAVEVRKRKLPEYEEPEVDPDDDLAGETPEETEIILEKYGVDEDDVIEEYLEDYYGENKRKKKSASPYRKNSQGKKPGNYKREIKISPDSLLLKNANINCQSMPENHTPTICTHHFRYISPG